MNKGKYNIITLGCQMNVHESEQVAGILEKMGYEPTKKPTDADIIVFNTCCIRESAEEKARSKIGALKDYKKKNKNAIIAVGGCMTQKEGESERLFKMFPFIDIVFGTQNLFEFERLLTKRIESKKKISKIDNSSCLPDEIFLASREENENAYVTIMYGCDNFCTYCIVPYVKGRERSREEKDVLTEVENLAKLKKYKTITLLGQNVNSYGKGCKTPTSFPILLDKICKIPGDFEIKFISSHPKDFSDELIATIAKNPKVSRDIHLPVQSGSSRVLEAMNRRYTREHYLKLAKKIKKSIPNCRFSTDIIVGFPGEAEKEFKQTLSLIKKIKFNNIYAFMYSPRSGTKAAKYDNMISNEEKHRRINILLGIQKKIEQKIRGER